MNTENPVQQAFRLLQLGRAQEAFDAASSAMAASPENPRAYLALGIAARILARWDDARTALERAQRLAPNDYAPAFELGRLCESLGQLEEALPHFRRAVELRPRFVPALFSLGIASLARARWSEAAHAFAQILALDAMNSLARINLAAALVEQREFARARSLLDEAATAEPSDPAIEHVMGRSFELEGRLEQALAMFERAAARSPRDIDYGMARARALMGLERYAEAVEILQWAVRTDPRSVAILRARGHDLLARGEFEHAAAVFRAAFEQAPEDVELPMFLAQVELLLGRWADGWRNYSRRAQRRQFEQERASIGKPYTVPPLDDLRGRELVLVGEQGIGDMLFFLRFAPVLVSGGACLSFAGDARLHSLLDRTGLFEALHPDLASAPGGATPILIGDLPLVIGASHPPYLPSLHIPADPARVALGRRTLEQAGPAPWVGVTWRAGTPRHVFARGLSKNAPLEPFFEALRGIHGTVVALQRDAQPAEIEQATRALGRPVADGSALGGDLEDVLAVVSLLDRHIGVSSANMHLAAAAGCTTDVLVPFPPEWRWRLAGDSAWFPGFRVLREDRLSGWEPTWRALAQEGDASSSRAAGDEPPR